MIWWRTYPRASTPITICSRISPHSITAICLRWLIRKIFAITRCISSFYTILVSINYIYTIWPNMRETIYSSYTNIFYIITESPSPHQTHTTPAASSSSAGGSGSPYSGSAPYKAQRQQTTVRERKRMLRSAPNGYIRYFLCYVYFMIILLMFCTKVPFIVSITPSICLL